MFYNGKVSSSTLLPTLQLARKATLWFPRNARRRPRDPHQLVLVCDTEVREHECAGLITIHDCMSWTCVHHERIPGDVRVVHERRKDGDIGHHMQPGRGPYDQAVNLYEGIVFVMQKVRGPRRGSVGVRMCNVGLASRSTLLTR